MRQLIRLVKNAKVSARRRLGLDDHARLFDEVYSGNAWVSGSGPGSSAADTAPYREFLKAFLADRQVKSVVDLGCGDWQFSGLIDWSGIDYTGVDVSKVALELAKSRAGPLVKFQHVNGVADQLPSADLLVAKDVLQHWSNQDILQFLPRLTEYKYALLTNGFPPRHTRRLNANIVPGERARPLDLAAAPFNVPGRIVFAYEGHEPKQVFLWERGT